MGQDGPKQEIQLLRHLPSEAPTELEPDCEPYTGIPSILLDSPGLSPFSTRPLAVRAASWAVKGQERLRGLRDDLRVR